MKGPFIAKFAMKESFIALEGYFQSTCVDR